MIVTSNGDVFSQSAALPWPLLGSWILSCRLKASRMDGLVCWSVSVCMYVCMCVCVIGFCIGSVAVAAAVLAARTQRFPGFSRARRQEIP